jgi:hypothetical protein
MRYSYDQTYGGPRVGYPNRLSAFDLADAADAQESASPRRIGALLGSLSPESSEAQAFRQGLQDAGYAEGRDVAIEWRSAAGDDPWLPNMVADLVRSKVEVMVVGGTPAAQAAKRATSSHRKNSRDCIQSCCMRTAFSATTRRLKVEAS